MYEARLPLRTLSLTFVVGLAIVFGICGSPDWHKHAQEGIELLHSHSHLGAHQHPHVAGDAAHAPSRDGERRQPDEDSSDGAEFVSFSGAGGEATTLASATVVAIAPLEAEMPAMTPATVWAWHGPRESRGPPSRRV